MIMMMGIYLYVVVSLFSGRMRNILEMEKTLSSGPMGGSRGGTVPGKSQVAIGFL